MQSVPRFDRVQARKLLSMVLTHGSVALSRHVRRRMAERDMTEQDIYETLRYGQVLEPELENSSWRYQIRWQRITCVVTFFERLNIIVVTAWRKS